MTRWQRRRSPADDAHGWPNGEALPEADLWPSDGDDPVVSLLERTAAEMEMEPRATLVDDVTSRIARAPASTAPRRFLAALSALDLRHTLRALRQCVAVALKPGSMLVRAQAMALVLVVVASVGVGASVSLVGASLVATELSRPSTDGEGRTRSRSTDEPTPGGVLTTSGPTSVPASLSDPLGGPQPTDQAATIVDEGPVAGATAAPRARPTPGTPAGKGKPEPKRTPKPREEREPQEPRGPAPGEPRPPRQPQKPDRPAEPRERPAPRRPSQTKEPGDAPGQGAGRSSTGEGTREARTRQE
jgi:hypothetical protein